MSRLLAVLAAVLVLGCISPEDTKVTTTTVRVVQEKPTATTLASKVVQTREEASMEAGADCDREADERLRNICWRDLAVMSGDPVVCGRIGQAGLIDECYYKVAVKSGDKAVCGNISDAGIRAVCESKG